MIKNLIIYIIIEVDGKAVFFSIKKPILCANVNHLNNSLGRKWAFLEHTVNGDF